jgi:hypothetical protein
MSDWLDAIAQGNFSLTMLDTNGEPMYYLTRREHGVHFNFQYFAPSGSNLPDLEVDFEITAANILNVFNRYGVDPNLDFIKGFEVISNSGLGEDFGKAITDGLIPIENAHYW